MVSRRNCKSLVIATLPLRIDRDYRETLQRPTVVPRQRLKVEEEKPKFLYQGPAAPTSLDSPHSMEWWAKIAGLYLEDLDRS